MMSDSVPKDTDFFNICPDTVSNCMDVRTVGIWQNSDQMFIPDTTIMPCREECFPKSEFQIGDDFSG